MRKWILATLVGFFAASSTGCVLPIYNGDPTLRVPQLLTTSEDLRLLQEEWERFWFIDQPSHMAPVRTHGGIL
jgi:hypothetical protein